MNISDADISRILDRLRDIRSELVQGQVTLTEFEVDVIITGLEIAAGE